jgi:predicted nucleic acid-binding protein
VIRIVADTNVYISTIVFGGTCEEILALAVEANFLVTGDKKHLQVLKTFRDIPIVSPREFFDQLR